MQYVLIVLLLLFSAGLQAEQVLSRVQVQGTSNRAFLRQFRNDSQTLPLQKKQASLHSIKRKAAADVEKIVDIAKYLGFYDVKVSHVVIEAIPVQILFQIDLGKKYTLASFQVESYETAPKVIPLKDLHLEVGMPIGNQQLSEAERILIWTLKRKGYAHCHITRKELIADAANHTLDATFFVEPGPLIRFGNIQLFGNSTVSAEAILKRILWKEGDHYDPKKIAETRESLEKTGLFSSLVISEEPDLLSENSLPITIDVQESKHKSIGAGVSYATSFGPGVRAEWENRNYRGEGEKLTFRTEVWEKYQTALLSLTQPCFHTRNQDLIWVLEYNKLHTIAFDSISYNCSSLFQRRLNRETEIGFGARLERLHSRSVQERNTYYLIKAPLQFKWSNANNLLDPTKGETLNIKLTPASQLLTPHFFYAAHTTSLSSYHSLPGDSLTLAAKVVFGNIIGASRYSIPPPDRFYGGSENVLRGYRAYSVSPLHDRRIPTGGRSILAGSFETRFRTKTDLGWVFFYDIGNVYTTNIPKITSTQLHS
ncbi:MAG: BamA/TamA family outer membrane protein, partial [Verrucomicrobia bacterium]|nr:BamA/TamA family outer membrane protein [Verrucomicrobiota bacterium]